MTLQRPIAPPEAPDYEFRRQHSLHKVWIAFKNGQESRTHYAKDCSATLQQLQWKHVAQVVFSQQASLDDCLRIEKFFKGKYRTLQIYRRGADDKFPKEPIIKYVDGKQVAITDDSLPPDVHCTVLYANPPEGSPKGTPFQFQLVKRLTAPARTAAPEPAPPVQDPPGKRLATEPTHFSKFIPGSAARYGLNK